jgi:hypothetical protein
MVRGSNPGWITTVDVSVTCALQSHHNVELAYTDKDTIDCPEPARVKSQDWPSHRVALLPTSQTSAHTCPEIVSIYMAYSLSSEGAEGAMSEMGEVPIFFHTRPHAVPHNRGGREGISYEGGEAAYKGLV